MGSTSSTIVFYFSLWAKLPLLDTSHCCSFAKNLSRSDWMKVFLSQKMNLKVIESVSSPGPVCAANERRRYAWNRTRYVIGNYPSRIIAQQKSVLLLLLFFISEEHGLRMVRMERHWWPLAVYLFIFARRSSQTIPTSFTVEVTSELAKDD